MKGVIYMAQNKIEKLYAELENMYYKGDFINRAVIFDRALSEGKISQDTYDLARQYYGKFWC
jgi:hypothetical protein